MFMINIMNKFRSEVLDDSIQSISRGLFWILIWMSLVGIAVSESTKVPNIDIQSVTYHDWKAYLLKNDLVKLHIVPDIGGRVIQYSLDDKDFFWINPDLYGRTSPETGLGPDGTWLNYGGDKLWPAPQGWDNDQQWPGPPDAVLDGQPYQLKIEKDPQGIRLTSRDDPRSGIRFSRLICLEPHSTHVSVEATMTNIDNKPRRWGIWAHSQFDAGIADGDTYNRQMRAWCPVNPQSRFATGYDVIFGKKDNPSFQVDDQRGLMKVSYLYRVGKIGMDSPAGWIATVDGRTGDVFVQRFSYEPEKEYPEGSSVEFWHNGLGRIYAYNKWIDMVDNRKKNPYVFESEMLSPYASLKPGDSYTWRYDWYACNIGGDFPVIECTDYGVVSEPLALDWDGDCLLQIQGRMGFFQPGKLILKTYDQDASMLSSEVLVDSVTPLDPVVLNSQLQLSTKAASVVVVLMDTNKTVLAEILRRKITDR